MARGINIPVASDASSVVREAKKVEDAFDGVIDSLDAVGDASKDAEKDTERSLDGIADEAKESGDRLERSFRDAFDSVRTDARKEGEKIGEALSDGVEDGARDVGEGVSEGMDDLASESQSTATEVAASFDGSMESILGGFQELAANAFAGFGPAGAIAGLAIAAGLGTFISQWQEDADAAKERIAGLADAMIEANSRVLAQDIINEQIKAIATNSDDAVISLQGLRDKNEELALDESELIRAFAGDAEARTKAIRILAGEQQDARRDALSGDAEVMASGTRRDAAATALLDQLKALDGEYQKGADSFTVYNDAVKAGHDETKGKIHSTVDEYNALHRTIDSLPRDVTTTVHVGVDDKAYRDWVWGIKNSTVRQNISANVTGMRWE